jgi:hypothetical protein
MDYEPNPLRLRLLLGKFRVAKLTKGLSGFRAVIDLGNSVTMTMDCPVSADVRLNDILTFYTEVPFDAHTVPPPVQ